MNIAWGMPQGSVVGPEMIVLYTQHRDIINKHKLQSMSYADLSSNHLYRVTIHRPENIFLHGVYGLPLSFFFIIIIIIIISSSSSSSSSIIIIIILFIYLFKFIYLFIYYFDMHYIILFCSFQSLILNLQQMMMA